jgi:hypothetical protein
MWIAYPQSAQAQSCLNLQVNGPTLFSSGDPGRRIDLAAVIERRRAAASLINEYREVPENTQVRDLELSFGTAQAAGRAGEVVESQPQRDRTAHPVRRAEAAAHAIDQAGQDHVEVTPVATAQGPLRAHRAAPDPRPHRARIAAGGERVQVAAGCGARHGDQEVLRQGGHVADRRESRLATADGQLSRPHSIR